MTFICFYDYLLILITDILLLFSSPFQQNGLNALHLSSKEGHLNIVTELLKRGANVDAATKVSLHSIKIPSQVCTNIGFDRKYVVI